jgi:hypothetical protein
MLAVLGFAETMDYYTRSGARIGGIRLTKPR